MPLMPQPLPDAPPPPPSEAEVLSQRKWTWLKGVGVGSILLVVVGLMMPLTLRSRKKSDQTEAVSNARQIGLALYEFEQEYGRYPNAGTIPLVRAKTLTDLDFGTTSSNEFFRQLIASGITSSEKMFYAKITGVKRPDDVITKGQALKKGECGFAYLAGLSAAGNPSRPLVVTPLIPGTDRFDLKRFDGKAIILRMDNSVTSMSIGKDGTVMLLGKNLLDPTNPVWGASDRFVIAWPD